jgi:hypothetical protein
MAKLNTYYTVPPTVDDILFGTDNTIPSRTRNFTIGGLFALYNDTYDIVNPTLQVVTDNGDTTTTAVHLDGGALSDSVNEQSLFVPHFVSSVNKNTGSGTQIDSLGFVSMSSNGIDTGIFAAEYVVGEVTLQVPNKPTGTYFIATVEDLPTQENIQDYVAPLFVHNNHTNASVTYEDALNEIHIDVTNAPSAGYTSVIKHKVKLGEPIAKGQAVYVSSADGTNMIVSKASNASEATSSKTMGLLETGGNTNAQVNVITEGLLAGLDTSTATIGDAVWLDVNGNLIFWHYGGSTIKPSAPKHLVFIGIVTRVNSNNGEIFVKVQNGFELEELHNVDIITTTPINGHLLGYNGTLWVNKTIAGWLGYTPANKAGDTFTGNIDAPSMSLNGVNLESLMIAYAVALG